ncbi:hypothetical protein PPERSA_04411 [Pseudocohnilembus persalinus]|uniref:Uncharacterized protein n=1 Tax=Pseudocohnilembus persalinus TaxID=266149 RepID=A0A0V0QQS0_PSEPJ|nr:hypothetical protein PPERSA_04411 [Pseudocohnilembus persalinus]|eukprot:KRX04596.1 hypothetical protein PPERSA_04411 [Pseudocohnilembus persalinus]
MSKSKSLGNSFEQIQKEQNKKDMQQQFQTKIMVQDSIIEDYNDHLQNFNDQEIEQYIQNSLSQNSDICYGNNSFQTKKSSCYKQLKYKEQQRDSQIASKDKNIQQQKLRKKQQNKKNSIILTEKDKKINGMKKNHFTIFYPDSFKKQKKLDIQQKKYHGLTDKEIKMLSGEKYQQKVEENFRIYLRINHWNLLTKEQFKQLCKNCPTGLYLKMLYWVPSQHKIKLLKKGFVKYDKQKKEVKRADDKNLEDDSIVKSFVQNYNEEKSINQSKQKSKVAAALSRSQQIWKKESERRKSFLGNLNINLGNSKKKGASIYLNENKSISDSSQSFNESDNKQKKQNFLDPNNILNYSSKNINQFNSNSMMNNSLKKSQRASFIMGIDEELNEPVDNNSNISSNSYLNIDNFPNYNDTNNQFQVTVGKIDEHSNNSKIIGLFDVQKSENQQQQKNKKFSKHTQVRNSEQIINTSRSLKIDNSVLNKYDQLYNTKKNDDYFTESKNLSNRENNNKQNQLIIQGKNDYFKNLNIKRKSEQIISKSKNQNDEYDKFESQYFLSQLQNIDQAKDVIHNYHIKGPKYVKNKNEANKLISATQYTEEIIDKKLEQDLKLKRKKIKNLIKNQKMLKIQKSQSQNQIQNKNQTLNLFKQTSQDIFKNSINQSQNSFKSLSPKYSINSKTVQIDEKKNQNSDFQNKAKIELKYSSQNQRKTVPNLVTYQENFPLNNNLGYLNLKNNIDANQMKQKVSPKSQFSNFQLTTQFTSQDEKQTRNLSFYINKQKEKQDVSFKINDNQNSQDNQSQKKSEKLGQSMGQLSSAREMYQSYLQKQQQQSKQKKLQKGDSFHTPKNLSKFYFKQNNSPKSYLSNKFINFNKKDEDSRQSSNIISPNQNKNNSIQKLNNNFNFLFNRIKKTSKNNNTQIIQDINNLSLQKSILKKSHMNFSLQEQPKIIINFQKQQTYENSNNERVQQDVQTMDKEYNITNQNEKISDFNFYTEQSIHEQTTNDKKNQIKKIISAREISNSNKKIIDISNKNHSFKKLKQNNQNIIQQRPKFSYFNFNLINQNVNQNQKNYLNKFINDNNYNDNHIKKQENAEKQSKIQKIIKNISGNQKTSVERLASPKEHAFPQYLCR